MTVQIAARIQNTAPVDHENTATAIEASVSAASPSMNKRAARRLAETFGKPRHPADRRGVLGLGQRIERAAIAGILAERRDVGAELLQLGGRRRPHDAARGDAHGGEVEGAQRLSDASSALRVSTASRASVITWRRSGRDSRPARLTTLTMLTPAFSGSVAPSENTVATVSVMPTAASATVVVSTVVARQIVAGLLVEVAHVADSR